MSNTRLSNRAQPMCCGRARTAAGHHSQLTPGAPSPQTDRQGAQGRVAAKAGVNRQAALLRRVLHGASDPVRSRPRG
jgi:hypothetical protein